MITLSFRWALASAFALLFLGRATVYVDNWIKSILFTNLRIRQLNAELKLLQRKSREKFDKYF
jgi:predicted Zn-dependent protease